MASSPLQYLLYSQKIWRGIKFDSLAVCLSTAKLKPDNISYLHIHVWQSLTEPPNLNPPIYFCKWRFGSQPPNLIPANISGYTVYMNTVLLCFATVHANITTSKHSIGFSKYYTVLGKKSDVLLKQKILNGDNHCFCCIATLHMFIFLSTLTLHILCNHTSCWIDKVETVVNSAMSCNSGQGGYSLI